MEPKRSHLRAGAFFIGVCALAGVALFVLDQGRGALANLSSGGSTERTSAVASQGTDAQETQSEAHLTQPGDQALPMPPPVTDAPGAATDMDGPQPPANSDDSTAELDGRTEQFVAEYYSVASDEAGATMSWLDGHYADSVEFFGKRMSKASILDQKRAYLQRWPVRSYRVIPGSAANGCDTGTMTCHATGMIEFEASSPDRGAISRGTANFATDIDFSGTTPLIVGETSKVISRK